MTEQSPPEPSEPVNEILAPAPVACVCPVVGLGASAGGIEAFQAFFTAMPPDAGMAYVVILHLSPDQKSYLASILERSTRMPVTEVVETTPLELNHVYVIPPDKLLLIEDSKLILAELPDERLKRKPVDAFFRTLAKACRERAVAIIFSGAGANGSMGVRDVKEAGGFVLVQDPLEAKVANMPQNAIATGVADRVLRIEEMAPLLAEFAANPYLDKAGPQADDDQLWNGLGSVLTVVRRRTGREFRSYKKNMLLRRTLRRMSLRQSPGFDDYARMLDLDSEETEALVEDYLIGVTRFFRDPELWAVLRTEVIEPLMRDGGPDAFIRAWVPGCASGEEAYSLAILMYDESRKAGRRGDFKIFATDTEFDRLQRAREGVFPDSIESDIPAELLSRYFDKEGDAYRVKPVIRETIVFAPHDLIHDPPFSKIDLITCRNLMIYLEPETQSRLLSLFHFALNPNGVLFLGSAETTTKSAIATFDPVAKKARIFRRTGPRRNDVAVFPLAGTTIARPEFDRMAARAGSLRRTRIDELVNRLLAARYAPAAVLVAANNQAVYFHGPTEKYFTQPAGNPTSDLLEMAREGFRLKLRKAIADVFAEKKAVKVEDARVRTAEGWLPIVLSVTPVVGAPDGQPMALVVVEERREATRKPSVVAPLAPDGSEEAYGQLEEDLRSTRAELESVIQELETSNEDQRASNEEIVSMNEELQSSNEELETSKEELQSLNEELATVNSQLNSKVHDLETSNNDLSNLLASTDIATIFLDTELHIRWYSPEVRDLLAVMPTDIGRPLADLNRNFDDPELMEDAGAVLRALAPVSRQITSQGCWFIRRIIPYRTRENRIDGIVITFSDVTDLKLAQVQERRLSAVLRDSLDALVVLDADGEILDWNRGAEKLYGWTAAEAIGKPFVSMLPPAAIPQFETQLAGLSARNNSRTLEAERITKDHRVVAVSVTVSRLADEGGKNCLIALTERDVTAQQEARRQLQEFSHELERRVAAATELARSRTEQLRKLMLELSRAEENERRRIAQILHDQLQQVLAGAQIQLSRVAKEYKGDHAKMAAASDLLAQAMQTARDLSHEVSPPVLREGLVPALDWTKRQCMERHGLEVVCAIAPDAEPANQEIRYLLFHSCRELLFNVVKHSETDKAQVSLERFDGHLRMTVSDKGRGFDPAAVTGRTDGAGYGLFGIRERVAAAGGELSIEAAPGKGARLTLSLPDVLPEDTREEDPAPIGHNGGEHAVSRQAGLRVVIVDDHELLRNGLRSLLEDEPGIEVAGEAANGKIALEVIAAVQPDVVLMDVTMPVLGGIEATRLIASRHPGVAVIGLSMFEPADFAGSMISAGASAYLQKTVPANDLVAAIRAAAAQAVKD